MDPKQLTEEIEAVTLEGGKKKKKTRSRPGRHRQIKSRVEMREKWEYEQKVRENCEGTRVGEKVYDKNSPFFAAFQNLEANFPAKRVMPDPEPPSDAENRFFKNLSRQLVSLLRWQLPSSRLAYSSLDGSAALEDVAKHLKVSPVEVAKAALPDDGGKRHIIIFELTIAGHREQRVAALGGHGFAVFSQVGNWPISVTGAESMPSLVHETDKAGLIRRSGYLSSMERPGGINFTVLHRGGYRKKADSLVTISSEKLILAISDGFYFFENRFSGIIYGAGQWKGTKWEGKIPVSYLDISSV